MPESAPPNAPDALRAPLPEAPRTRLEHKHPLAIRWFHWLNFPLLTIMIWSGLLIYWAVNDKTDSTYNLRLGGLTLFHFFPAAFYHALHLDFRLSDGRAFHFFFMWFFAINGIAYVLYTFLSGEWRQLLPNRHSFQEAIDVTLYDLHLSKVPPPRQKFNGAQRIAYTAIVVMGGLSLITGLAIYSTVQFSWLTTLCGGYKMARFEHFWLTIGYVVFFVVHVGQVIRTGWNNFRSMITGYEVVPVEEPAR